MHERYVLRIRHKVGVVGIGGLSHMGRGDRMPKGDVKYRFVIDSATLAA